MSHPDLKQLNLYKSLMEEVKARFTCINMAATGKLDYQRPSQKNFAIFKSDFCANWYLLPVW
jgi:hypothetical protein